MSDQQPAAPGRTPIPRDYAARVPPPARSEDEQDAYGRARGWKPSRKAQPCLRWVAGRQCLSEACVCLSGTYSGILDHPRMWLTGDGGRVLVAEPYDMGTDYQRAELARLTEAAVLLGLVVEERPEESVWYPPYTSLLLVRRGDAGPSA